MIWDLFNFIGTIAFAISGTIVAMEEDYDILGLYFLGFTTAFGGGAFRNLLTGIPIETIWSQNNLFVIAFVTITGIFLIPDLWLKYWNKWGILFDAIGLAAFAIQGALYAQQIGAPLSGVLVAATLTGTGGGLIRDLFAGRKPMIFREEIYALWTTLGGLAIGLGLINGPWATGVLFISIVGFRMLSVYYGWRLPRISTTK